MDDDVKLELEDIKRRIEALENTVVRFPTITLDTAKTIICK